VKFNPDVHVQYSLLFLCSFLQAVNMIHSLTNGKLLTVKLKETKKSLDSMWIKSRSGLSCRSFPKLKWNFVIDVQFLFGMAVQNFKFLYMFFIYSSHPNIVINRKNYVAVCGCSKQFPPKISSHLISQDSPKVFWGSHNYFWTSEYYGRVLKIFLDQPTLADDS